MSGMRRALGILPIIAAPVAVAVGYANAPAATAQWAQMRFWAGKSEPKSAFGPAGERA